MAKTTITKRDYHALCGLMVLAKRHNDALKQIEGAVAELVGVAQDAHGYAGHVSDETWCGNGEPNADRLLSKLEITVEE